MRMIMTSVLCAVAGMAAARADPGAIEGRYTDAYRVCRATGGIACVTAEFIVQDNRLAEAYAAALRGRNEAHAADLRAEQAAFTAKRDFGCAQIYDLDPHGDRFRLEVERCRLEQTVQRTIELEAPSRASR